jgi:hypothetical protein
MSKGLNELRDEAFRIAKEHGFKDASIGEDVALFHSEASELLEDHRDGSAPTEVWYEIKTPAYHGNGAPMMVGGKQLTVAVRSPLSTTTEGHFIKPCGIPSELADIVIRVLHFSGKHGIDIEKAVVEKMAYNESRPYLHGGKKL